MTAAILDGAALAKTLKAEFKAKAEAFAARHHGRPTLAAILVGDDPASRVYIRNKRKSCEEAGLGSQFFHLPALTGEAELLDLVNNLNEDPTVHGILVQLPLPPQIRPKTVLDAIRPLKDVDAFHPENVGLLSQGRPRFLPCTPAGIVELLVRSEIATAGKQAVVIGRSDIVGKPMALLLMQRGRGGDATVTVCHSRTPELAEVCRRADILIAAIGKAEFVTADMVKPGATVIDVGMNRKHEKLVGDVDFAAVREVAGAITPVPGGVGPLTVAMLLQNTLTAANLQTGDGG